MEESAHHGAPITHGVEQAQAVDCQDFLQRQPSLRSRQENETKRHEKNSYLNDPRAKKRAERFLERRAAVLGETKPDFREAFIHAALDQRGAVAIHEPEAVGMRAATRRARATPSTRRF